MNDFTNHFGISWLFNDIWRPIKFLEGLPDVIQLTRDKFILEQISRHTDVQNPGIFTSTGSKKRGGMDYTMIKQNLFLEIRD
jgi:hypothetical protein